MDEIVILYASYKIDKYVIYEESKNIVEGNRFPMYDERFISLHLFGYKSSIKNDNRILTTHVYITEFGKQFLKACLNEKSEELIKEIINNKEQENDQ